jgi:hypothetical protein
MLNARFYVVRVEMAEKLLAYVTYASAMDIAELRLVS